MNQPLFKIIFVVALSLNVASCQEPVSKQPNVLFIAVDDLRPDLGIYGDQTVISPNIDKLGGQGTIFINHYVTVPTCGASRASMLTGLLPTSRNHLSNHVFRDIIAKKSPSTGPETFVHHLKQNGYYTVGIGKMSHSVDGFIYAYDEPVGTEKEMPLSWDEMLMDTGDWGTGWNSFFAYSGGENRTDSNKMVKPYQASDVPDEGYPDGLTANLAVKKLGELAEKKQPFFLGVGFFKPHLPFNAPKKYWDMYEEEDMPPSPNPFLPENVSRKSLHTSNELNQYKLGEEKAGLDSALTDNYAKKLMHGYRACITYMDVQVGKVLNELERLGLRENTIIVLWGDHGWHLGDHRLWGKHALFDRSLRSPLIIATPNYLKNNRIENVVSSVDIYPTISELCNLPAPDGLDGSTLTALLTNENSTKDNGRAYSYFRNGISLKTQKYRLVKYFREEQPTIELYDHKTDPYETKNVAEDHPEIIKRLMPLLDMGDTGIYSEKSN